MYSKRVRKLINFNYQLQSPWFLYYIIRLLFSLKSYYTYFVSLLPILLKSRLMIGANYLICLTKPFIFVWWVDLFLFIYLVLCKNIHSAIFNRIIFDSVGLIRFQIVLKPKSNWISWQPDSKIGIDLVI